MQNTIEDLYNLMLAKGSTDFNVADSTTIGKLALRQDRNAWVSQLNGSNDDAGVSAQAGAGRRLLTCRTVAVDRACFVESG